MSSKIILERKKIKHKEKYILILPDNAAGYTSYTVYLIPSSPGRRIKIIGRELPLWFAKKIAKAKQHE